MAGPIILVDTSDVLPGKREDLRQAMEELAALVRAKEPRTIAYGVYFDEAGARMTVVQVHPDGDALEHHMKVAGPMFPRFRDLVRMRSMDVYGRPEEALLERLRDKARLLGAGPVEVHSLAALAP